MNASRLSHTHTQPPVVFIVIGLNVALRAVLLTEASECLQFFLDVGKSGSNWSSNFRMSFSPSDENVVAGSWFFPHSGY